MKCLEKAHALNPKNVEASSLLGQIYMEVNMSDKAINIYESVTSSANVGEYSWVWIRLGLIYSKKKLHDKAIVS